MNNITISPCLTSDGVTFTVTVDYKAHDCVISQEALSSLCQSADKKLDLIATYQAYEAKIQGIARRLVTAGITGSPIMLGPHNFR
ncbi:MAG: DUF1488 family protein [Burkholderiales bacterium]